MQFAPAKLRRSPRPGKANVRAHLTVLSALLACPVFMLPAPAQEHAQEGLLVREHLVLPVSINDTGPFSFVLDLGIQQAMLSVEVARYLGLEPLQETITSLDPLGQPSTAAVVAAGAVSISDIPAHALTFTVVDPALLSKRLGMEVAGLLPGHQPGFEVEIQPEQGRVVWRTLEQALLKQEDADTLRMRVDDSGTPTTAALVNTISLQNLQLDIAFDGVLALPPEVLRQFEVTPQNTPQLRIDGLGQTQVRLREVRLGAVQVEGPVCTVLPEGARGRVGLGLLRHFTLVLNYEHGLLRLAPNGATLFRDPPLTGNGLALYQRAGNGWHVQVAVPSPAYAAGIRTGDALIALDGVPLGPQVAEEALREALQAPEGTSHTVTLERGGQTMTVQLESVRLL